MKNMGLWACVNDDIRYFKENNSLDIQTIYVYCKTKLNKHDGIMLYVLFDLMVLNRPWLYYINVHIYVFITLLYVFR